MDVYISLGILACYMDYPEDLRHIIVYYSVYRKSIKSQSLTDVKLRGI